MAEQKIDIHNYKHQLDRIMLRIEHPERSIIDKRSRPIYVIPENKKIIVEFKDYLISEGIGVAKIGRYMVDIVKFDSLLKKPFPEATELDIRKVIAEIEQSNLAPESKKSFKVLVRKLYRYVYKDKLEDEKYPRLVRWIKINLPKNAKKLPDELLSEEEILKIIQNCKNIRDKALVACLAESGCRISEVGGMRINQIAFEEYGTRMVVSGKTGMRKLLVINCTPYLKEWLNVHPNNSDSKAYLWCNPSGEALTYSRLTSIIQQSAKNAGIKKRVYCHLFRHSKATQFASIMSEASMKQYFGWGQDSKMCAVYIHMNGRETDSAILKANGIDLKTEKQESKLKPKNCIKCKAINETTNIYCKVCGFPLDEEQAKTIIKKDTERLQADDVMNKLLNDPEVLDLIKKKLSS